jgi:hypothetical protein
VSQFSLRKWYLDCVADDGTAWIGYWGDLRWGQVHVPFVSSLSDAKTTSALRSEPEPRDDGEQLTWSAPSLDVEVLLRPLVTAEPWGLHDGVRWHCVAPRADAIVKLGGRTIRGLGYAEVLELTVPPWRLPLRELHWGRFTGETTSLVWIEWRGPSPLRVALWDGQPAEVRAIGAGEIALAGGKRLVMTGTSPLREDSLARTLKPLRPLARLLPRTLQGAVEQKWLSRGTMFAGDRPIDEGWAIHELFTFGAD